MPHISPIEWITIVISSLIIIIFIFSNVYHNKKNKVKIILYSHINVNNYNW